MLEGAVHGELAFLLVFAELAPFPLGPTSPMGWGG